MQKTFEDVEKFVAATANHQGWEVNPDKEFLSTIIEGLAGTWNTYGYFQCPCRDSWGVREKDKDIICPCEYCRPDMKEYGHCFCGLFLTKDFAASGKSASPIPERRPDFLYP